MSGMSLTAASDRNGVVQLLAFGISTDKGRV